MFTNKDQKEEAEIINSSNTIGKGTILYGDIETHGNLRVEGKVEGNIKTKSKIVLGKSSIVKGNVQSQNAELEGEVTGDVKVFDLLIVKSGSVIHGNITTNKLIVESGAKFNGGCKMGTKAGLKGEVKIEEKPKNVTRSDIKEPLKAGTA